jgi:hypothetical protein
MCSAQQFIEVDLKLRKRGGIKFLSSSDDELLSRGESD